MKPGAAAPPMVPPPFPPTAPGLVGRTLLVGRLAPTEMMQLARMMPDLTEWPRVDGLDDAVALLRQGADRWGCVLLARGRPGELADAQAVHRLLGAAPDARVVSLCGAWCEGEARTGKPWGGAERVYWADLPAWWRREGLGAGSGAPGARPRWVLVDAPHASFGAACVDALGSLGVDAVYTRRGSWACVTPPAAVVWRGAMLDGREARDLAAVCGRWRPTGARVVVVLDFPRWDAVRTALDIGAQAVLGAPVDLAALAAAVSARSGCVPTTLMASPHAGLRHAA